jgi:hypothetical protein
MYKEANMFFLEFIKKIKIIFIALLILAGCGKTNKSSQEDNDLIVVDLNQDYPAMSISINVDVNWVEYIPLETNADFLCAEGKIIAFTDELIIYSNEDRQGGDILIFNAMGKALKKINHKGQSGEEYTYKSDVIYDDESRELFVNDEILDKIFVYDLNGNFKRSLRYSENLKFQILEISNFDEESLLCHTPDEKIEQPWFLISKQTGEKIQDISIPSIEKVSTIVSSRKRDNGNTIFSVLPIKYAINNGNEIILNEPSSDTIFGMGRDKILKPLIARTPAVSAMNPQCLLVVEAKSEDFLFLKSYNKRDITEYGQIVPVDLIYSYSENIVFRGGISYAIINQKSQNNDQNSKSIVNEISLPLSSFVNHNWRKDIIVYSCNSSGFKSNYDKQDNKEEFSEKYKTAVSQIEEDSNPVLVKIKLSEDHLK